MAISVVQATTVGNLVGSPWTGNFSSNVTAGNTVILALTTFNSSNVTISTSSPTLGGSSVSGASKIAEVQSAYSGFTAYTVIWLLPNATGGATSFGLSVTNQTTGNTQTGLAAWEVSGLGSSPAVDVSSTASGASTAATSGTTGGTTHAAEIIVGMLVGLDGLTNSPTQPTGYTNQNIGSAGSASVGGYQIQSSSGSTYTYATANAGTDQWAGAIVAVYQPGAAAASGQVQPLTTFRPLRSRLSRAVTGFVPVVTYNTGHGPAGTVQPLATFPTPRRRPARTVTGFTPVKTFNTGHGPAGTVQPLAVPAAAPRRRPARTVTQFVPVTTTNNTHPVAPPLPPTQGGGKSMLSRYMRWADL